MFSLTDVQYKECKDHMDQRGLNTKRPTIVFFLGPTKPLPLYGQPAPAIQC